MSDDGSPRNTIHRTFRDLSDKEVADSSILIQMGWTGSFGWGDLLQSQRILIVAEAGAGKTFECHARCDLLWKAGHPAFHLELATLARSTVRDMLTAEEETRFDEWMRAQSD